MQNRSLPMEVDSSLPPAALSVSTQANAVSSAVMPVSGSVTINSFGAVSVSLPTGFHGQININIVQSPPRKKKRKEREEAKEVKEIKEQVSARSARAARKGREEVKEVKEHRKSARRQKEKKQQIRPESTHLNAFYTYAIQALNQVLETTLTPDLHNILQNFSNVLSENNMQRLFCYYPEGLIKLDIQFADSWSGINFLLNDKVLIQCRFTKTALRVDLGAEYIIIEEIVIRLADLLKHILRLTSVQYYCDGQEVILANGLVQSMWEQLQWQYGKKGNSFTTKIDGVNLHGRMNFGASFNSWILDEKATLAAIYPYQQIMHGQYYIQLSLAAEHADAKADKQLVIKMTPDARWAEIEEVHADYNVSGTSIVNWAIAFLNHFKTQEIYLCDASRLENKKIPKQLSVAAKSEEKVADEKIVTRVVDYLTPEEIYELPFRLNRVIAKGEALYESRIKGLSLFKCENLPTFRDGLISQSQVKRSEYARYLCSLTVTELKKMIDSEAKRVAELSLKLSQLMMKYKKLILQNEKLKKSIIDYIKLNDQELISLISKNRALLKICLKIMSPDYQVKSAQASLRREFLSELLEDKQITSLILQKGLLNSDVLFERHVFKYLSAKQDDPEAFCEQLRNDAFMEAYAQEALAKPTWFSQLLDMLQKAKEMKVFEAVTKNPADMTLQELMYMAMTLDVQNKAGRPEAQIILTKVITDRITWVAKSSIDPSAPDAKLKEAVKYLLCNTRVWHLKRETPTVEQESKRSGMDMSV